jgi:hypothetical protein
MVSRMTGSISTMLTVSKEHAAEADFTVVGGYAPLLRSGKGSGQQADER